MWYGCFRPPCTWVNILSRLRRCVQKRRSRWASLKTPIIRTLRVDGGLCQSQKWTAWFVETHPSSFMTIIYMSGYSGSLTKPHRTINRYIGFVLQNINKCFYLTNSLLLTVTLHIFIIQPQFVIKTSMFGDISIYRKENNDFYYDKVVWGVFFFFSK